MLLTALRTRPFILATTAWTALAPAMALAQQAVGPASRGELTAEVTRAQAAEAKAVQSGGDGSSLTVKPTASTPLALSLSQWAAQNINVASYITAADPDATSGINRAAAFGLSLGLPMRLVFPCGSYTLSGSAAITTAAAQGLDLHGAGADCVTIKQTADADAFTVSLTNYGGVFGTGAFRVSGIKFQMAAAGSTTRKAVSISSTAASGAAGVPLVLDDLTFASASTTSYWGNEIYLSQIPNAVYLSRISGYYPGQSTGGVHVSINGTSGAYTTSVFASDLFLVNGQRGLELGNYLQGIHGRNVNTIGTAYALYSAPTAGINEEIQLADSYLCGKVYLVPTSPGTLSQVAIHHTYFDTLSGISNNDTQVTIGSVSTLALDQNIFNGSSTITGVTALSVSGSNMALSRASGNKFQGYSSSGSIAVKLALSTYGMIFEGTQFAGNATNVSDSSSVTNQFVSSTFDNAFYNGGGGNRNGFQFTGGTAGTQVNYFNINGPDANIQTLFTAKGLPSVDFAFRDGLGHNILTLKDSQNATTGNGVTLSAATSGVSPKISSDGTTNLMLGTSGALATGVTGGMVQIPYMSGAPTGTPATTGGATTVYNASSHALNVYDPVAGAWYGIALTAGAK